MSLGESNLDSNRKGYTLRPWWSMSNALTLVIGTCFTEQRKACICEKDPVPSWSPESLKITKGSVLVYSPVFLYKGGLQYAYNWPAFVKAP